MILEGTQKSDLVSRLQREGCITETRRYQETAFREEKQSPGGRFGVDPA